MKNGTWHGSIRITDFNVQLGRVVLTKPDTVGRTHDDRKEECKQLASILRHIFTASPLYERFVGHSWKCQERWHVPKLAERTCKIILLLPVHLIGLLFLTKLWQCLNLRRKLLRGNSWVFWMRWTIQRGLHQMFRVFIHIFQAKKKYRTTTLRNFTKHASKEKVTWNVGFLSLSYLFSNIVIVFY